jgi:hypothetical protein
MKRGPLALVLAVTLAVGVQSAVAAPVPAASSSLNLGLALRAGAPGPNNAPSTAANPYLAADILYNIDDFKNKLADRVGLPHEVAGVVETDTSAANLYPSFYNLFVAWGAKRQYGSAVGVTAEFPNTALMNGLRDRGIVPMISWAPAAGSPTQGGYTWYPASSGYDGSWGAPNQLIASGSYDRLLEEFRDGYDAWKAQLSDGDSARGAPKYDSILMRYAWEMNKPYFIWSDHAWGGYAVANDAANFGAAWRRVYEKLYDPFADDNEANILFLFSPSGSDTAHYPSEAVSPPAGWPSADHWNTVHYLGFDTYNVLTCGPGNVRRYYSDRPSPPPYDDLGSKVNQWFQDMKDLGPQPFIVGEYGITNPLDVCPTGSTDSDDAERAMWLGDGIAAAAAVSSRIISLGYFHVDMRAREKPENNWEFGGDGTNAVWHAYADKAADVTYQAAWPFP